MTVEHDSKKNELERELTQIASGIKELKDNRSLKLGLFGVRGSGKSSWLAALWMFPNDQTDGIDLIFPDENSQVYLKRISKSVLETGKPGATESRKVPTVIQFRLTLRTENWNVETRDFTGAFIESIDDAEAKKLAMASRDFLRKCDVILCFHDWKDQTISP